LGLQTIHEASAVYIRRGYPLKVFEEQVYRLHSRNIAVIVHTILGLPNETKHEMLMTTQYLAKLPIQGIKLQLLHILQGTI
jgi:radical SAM superfamily enzyme